MMVRNERGGYAFLPALNNFLSQAVLPDDGFEIVRATFREPPPFPEGLRRVEDHLRNIGRPAQALSGLELRSGRQQELPEFLAFNAGYIDALRKADLLVDGKTPLTRTNMALPWTEPQHRIHAFSYTVPVDTSVAGAPVTFMTTGIPDVRFLPNAYPEMIGDTKSVEGLRKKMTYVVETIGGTLETIGVGWQDVTALQLYTVLDVQPLLGETLAALGPAGRRGIQWHHAHLPTSAGGDFEMDVRSMRLELLV